MDVDCSSITYETKPSEAILTAVGKAKKYSEGKLLGKPKTEIEENIIVEALALGSVQSKNESLATSLLTNIDANKATHAELKEAFCRDIDSFSFEMEVYLLLIF